MKVSVSGLISSGAAALWLAVASGAMAQPPAANSGAAKMQPNPNPMPRASDGKPDLSGTWQAGGVSIFGEPGAPPLHPLPPAPIKPPARQPIPYQPWADAKRKTLTVLDDPTSKCFLPGVPRITGMPMPLEIVQKPNEVVILYESFRAWRRIPLDDQLRHSDDLTPTWMGDSVGKWDGDTLVVDVTGFNDKTWLAGQGTIHTDKLHVIERFKPINYDTILYEATVDDPGALTKPWTTSSILRRPIDVHVEEYECIENNPDNDHIKRAFELEKKNESK
ncbi:MAG TPA: hypothetical protein VKV17_05585 [Bryobacteraceae bacterium]|nr:hypothetical protein [Bryobacteraceae bacterium]